MLAPLLLHSQRIGSASPPRATNRGPNQAGTLSQATAVDTRMVQNASSPALQCARLCPQDGPLCEKGWYGNDGELVQHRGIAINQSNCHAAIFLDGHYLANKNTHSAKERGQRGHHDWLLIGVAEIFPDDTVHMVVPNDNPAGETDGDWHGRINCCSTQPCPDGTYVNWTKFSSVQTIGNSNDPVDGMIMYKGSSMCDPPPGPPAPPWKKKAITIRLRGDPTKCMDSTGADGASPVSLAPCVQGKMEQRFGFEQGGFLVLDPASGVAKTCVKKHGGDTQCCVENLPSGGGGRARRTGNHTFPLGGRAAKPEMDDGQCTVVGCNEPALGNKQWVYDKGNGMLALATFGQCMWVHHNKFYVAKITTSTSCTAFDIHSIDPPWPPGPPPPGQCSYEAHFISGFPIHVLKLQTW